MININPKVSRRALFGGLGVATGAITLTACGGGSDNGGGGSTGGTSADGTLVIGTAVAASNQFPLNFNRYGGGDTSPGSELIFETLFRLSSKDGGQLLPVLAEKVVHNDEGTIATYTLRKGVKWSDGEPFTSADVAYTLGTIYGPPVASPPEGEFAWLAKPIETPDEHTVVVTYNNNQRQQEANLALYYPMVPAHVYQIDGKLEFPQDTMAEPVGTGPYTLSQASSQLIRYERRDDYWGGVVSAKQIDLVPSGQAGNIETQITQGNVDMAQYAAPGVVNGFAKASETNVYEFIPDGAARGVIFQMQHEESPIYDVNVRKALRVGIDFEAVRDAAGVGYSLPNIVGVDPMLNSGLQAPEFNKPVGLDVEAAKQFLAASAWTVNANGNLEKDGQEHPLAIQIQNDNAEDMVTVPVIISQWKEHLGITVAFEPKPKDVMDTIFSSGEFDLVVSGLNYPGTPFSNYTMYFPQPGQGTAVKPRGEVNHNGNWGRWVMPAPAQEAMQILVQTLSIPDNQAKIAEGVQGVQASIFEDAPYAPFQGGGVGMMSTTKNWKRLPDVADVNFFPRVTGSQNLTEMLLTMQLA